MRGVMSWNGVRSDLFGIDIESYPNHTKPTRKVETFSIPGRNGDLIMVQDAWSNVERSYDIQLGNGKKGSIVAGYDSITEWLCAPNGYCELWDDFDPYHYRLACLTDQIDLEALIMGRAGRATIRFTCKPQRYLLSGKDGIVFSSSPSTLLNQTAYASRPLIYVQRSAAGNGTVTVGNTVFTITGIPSTGMYIDCEEMHCKDGNGANVNSIVSSSTSEFATLKPGPNNIGFTGNVQRITITPRWFEI